jgi:phosphoserine phosphatase
MEEYKKILSELYLEKNLFFDPSLDSVFFIEKNWGGIYSSSLKAIMFDVDDTLNPEGSKNLSTLWVENLPFGSNEIEKLKELINKIGEISSRAGRSELEVREAVNKFGKKLAELNLRKEDYLEVSKVSAKEFELNPYTSEGLKEIKNLGYSVGLNSGAPQEAVRFLAQRLGILKDNCFGSMYEFDKNNKFTGRILPGLNFRKEEAFDKFLRFYGCKSKFSIFMTDNPKSDLAPSSKAGFRIFLSEEKQENLELSVYLPEIRKEGVKYYDYEGMEIVVHFLKRWDLLNIIYFLRSPEKEKEIVSLALSLEEIKNKVLEGENLMENKRKFIDFAEKILSFLSPVYSRNSFGLEDYLDKLSFTIDEEKIKTLTSSIYLRMKEKVPELDEKELKNKRFLEKITEIVQE